MNALIIRFIRNNKGATAIEYAMIASLVFLAIVVAVAALGTAVASNLYDKIGSAFN